MMFYTADYVTPEEKAALVAEAEAKGFRVLSDTFSYRQEVDSDGNTVNIKAGGTLEVDNAPEKAPLPLPPDLKAAWAAADTTQAKLSVLAKRLGLE